MADSENVKLAKQVINGSKTHTAEDEKAEYCDPVMGTGENPDEALSQFKVQEQPKPFALSSK